MTNQSWFTSTKYVKFEYSIKYISKWVSIVSCITNNYLNWAYNDLKHWNIYILVELALLTEILLWKFGMISKIHILKAMDLGFFNFRRTLLWSIKVIFQLPLILLNWRSIGINFRILGLLLFVLVENALAIWLRCLKIFIFKN